MNLEVSIFWVSFFFFEYIIKRVFYYRLCLYLVEKEEFYCGYFMRLRPYSTLSQGDLLTCIRIFQCPIIGGCSPFANLEQWRNVRIWPLIFTVAAVEESRLEGMWIWRKMHPRVNDIGVIRHPCNKFSCIYHF